MGNEREMYPKSNFRYIVYIVRVEGEGDEKKYKVVDTKIQRMNAKAYYNMCRAVNRTPVRVFAKPEKFQFNEQYMLATRNVVWTWTEEE